MTRDYDLQDHTTEALGQDNPVLFVNTARDKEEAFALSLEIENMGYWTNASLGSRTFSTNAPESVIAKALSRLAR